MTQIQYSATVEMVTEVCCTCGVVFGVTQDYQKKRRADHLSFKCPDGHSQSYGGLSEAERLRKELKSKEQELANQVALRFQVQAQKDKAEADKLKAEKKLKRVQKGVCPCCTRSFQNLKQHMASQHPEVKAKR
jgi:hypothetical protein